MGGGYSTRPLLPVQRRQRLIQASEGPGMALRYVNGQGLGWEVVAWPSAQFPKEAKLRERPPVAIHNATLAAVAAQ